MKIKKFNKSLNKTLILFFAIIVLGFSLRSHNFTTWPRLGATFDEYAWTWLGINLIQQKIPISWSPHQQYENKKQVIYQNTHFQIVKPYLEHPPFFGIVAGSFAMLNGVKDMYDIDLEKIRPLALILGTLSIGLLFLLVREIYDKNTALLASFIYATVPTIVIGSRIVQNENFFIPMFLAILFFVVKFINTGKTKFRNIAALLCGLLIISKIPWAAATLGVMAILFYKNKYRDAWKLFTVVMAFFLLYIGYGIYFNQDLFINLWKLQLQRYDLAFNSIFALFTEPFLVDRYMIDGWIYFGWIALFLLLVKDFKHNFVIIFALLGYLAVFVFGIPNEPGHGWYRYPFYPFLALSLALFIKDYFNKNLLLTFLFILFVGLSLLELTWARVFGFSFVVFRLFLFLSASALLPLFLNNLKVKKYSYAINNLTLILIFLLSVWSVLVYNEQ